VEPNRTGVIDTTLRLLGVFILVGANAFFVAGEFGLLAAPRPTIARLAEEGDRRARRTSDALTRLSFHLSGAQLGITVSSLVLGFIAKPAIADVISPLFGEATTGVSVAIALLLATTFQMVFGELYPKNFAIARPLTTALRVGPLMARVNGMVSPLILFLNGAAERTVRMLGIEPRDELTSIRSLEELELMITSSAAEGGIEPAEARLMKRSIGFHRRLAGEVMTPRTDLTAIPADATVAGLAALSTETGLSRFPVTSPDIDHVLGVVHVKDLFRIPPSRRPHTAVEELTRPALAIPETMPLDELLRRLQAAKTQMALVVDEHGGTAGLVTLEDLLEQIIGKIRDEFDPADDEIPDGSGTVPGGANRYEVQEACGFDLPRGSWETIGGFLMAQLGRIPHTGDRIQHEEWIFQVTAMNGYRVEAVRVTRPRGHT
jgi:CBS domain containing-hemolysin-like protein